MTEPPVANTGGVVVGAAAGGLALVAATGVLYKRFQEGGVQAAEEAEEADVEEPDLEW